MMMKKYLLYDKLKVAIYTGRRWELRPCLAKGGREREQSKMIGRKIKEQEKNANENKKKKGLRNTSRLVL